MPTLGRHDKTILLFPTLALPTSGTVETHRSPLSLPTKLPICIKFTYLL